MFDFYQNHSLKLYNTFHLDVKAKNFLLLNTKEDWTLFCESHGNPDLHGAVFILGGGSNVLFLNDYEGLIIHPKIEDIKVLDKQGESTLVKAGAGVVWDELVAWAVESGLGGLENLSLIPGSVGAAPVQNIGAYGAEVKDVIESVQGIELETGKPREFLNAECQFGYRNSIFKTDHKNSFLITSVVFRLENKPLYNLSYGHLKNEVESLGEVNLQHIRAAVIRIRQSKLPDVKLIGNAGSFFKNPVVEKDLGESLKASYPDMPVYPVDALRTKLAAGWLIEKAGWKGYRSGDTGVYDKQALVLVNYGHAKGADIYELSGQIIDSVQGEFGVQLEREVNVVME